MPKNELMNDYMIRELQLSSIYSTSSDKHLPICIPPAQKGGIVSYVALIVSTKP